MNHIYKVYIWSGDHQAKMNILTGYHIVDKQNEVENFYKICLYFVENGLTLHSEYIG